MKASDAVIVWNWDDAGIYTGPEPQIDVIRRGDSGKNWRRFARSIPVTTKDQLQLSLLLMFHDLTVLYGCPAKKVSRALWKIDEYKELFTARRALYYRSGTFKEATCPTL